MGRGGPQVSTFGLGTMTFGAETDEATARSQLDMFVAHGGTLIDTADVYSAGVSEEIIGRWGKQRGGMDDLIVATKSRFAPPQGSYGGSRRAITRTVEASLRRLQVETIDLYFIHGWDTRTPLAETLHVINDLTRAGKIHNTAWSNVSGWQLQKILSTADALGVERPVALQPQYNLLERGIEYEVLPCALEEEVSLTPWSPLAGGWLTGKYSADKRPTGATRLGEDPGRGVEAYDVRGTEKTFEVLDVLTRVAETYGRPMSHVALAWLSARPGVASVLLGARTPEQLRDNLAAADLELGAEALEALNKASALAPCMARAPFPYNFLADWCDMDVWSQLGSFGN